MIIDIYIYKQNSGDNGDEDVSRELTQKNSFSHTISNKIKVSPKMRDRPNRKFRDEILNIKKIMFSIDMN